MRKSQESSMLLLMMKQIIEKYHSPSRLTSTAIGSMKKHFKKEKNSSQT